MFDPGKKTVSCEVSFGAAKKEIQAAKADAKTG